MDSSLYATHSRPKIAQLLKALQLDVVYERGEGCSLYYRDPSGKEIEILDMVGGYGAALLGHNHPELVATAQALLSQGRPFSAQGSIRETSGALAARLSDLVGRSTGQHYITTLTNSGAEAIEAALKHAAYAQQRTSEEILHQIERSCRQLRVEVKNGRADLSADFIAFASAQLDLPLRSLEAGEIVDLLEDRLISDANAVLWRPPLFLALEGAFHGKTAGALQLTHNKAYRQPWQRLGLHAKFMRPHDLNQLENRIEAEKSRYRFLEIGPDGMPQLVSRAWSNIAALLIEPIQGEGGIVPLSADYLAGLRAITRTAGIPLIIDEIQSGLGRTGRFLASAPVQGDIYTFSKALGGGLAKIGAMLVEQGQYIPDFGYLHTSTFADDDFSSAIALKTLDLIDADNGALMRRCAEMGDYLLARLRQLCVTYPAVIRGVRGKGLMIGVELVELDGKNRSGWLNVASEQGRLAYLLAGYLFHAHRIRIAPTLSAPHTLRIEPPASISREEIDHFCHGLEAGVALIAAGRSGDLLRYLTSSQAPSGGRFRPLPLIQRSIETRHVACIGHLIDPYDPVRFDPTLGQLTPDESDRLSRTIGPLLDPFVAHHARVWAAEEEVRLTLIGIPYTTGQIEAAMRVGETGPILGAIEAGIDMAKGMGCMQVGLTGHTSIVTHNCTKLVEDKIGLTSGNALTVAAAGRALHVALDEACVDLEDLRLGIVGGVGNIGRVLALLESQRVGNMTLFGRRGRHRLEKLADSIYLTVWGAIQRGEPLTGIGHTLASRLSAIQLSKLEVPSFATVSALLGEEAPIKISTDLVDLRSCQAVLSATNAAQPMIQPEHLGEHPTLICDVALPGDVDPQVVREKPHTRLIEGGLMRLPGGQALDLPVGRVPHDCAYACVAETLILGLAGIRSHFSYGPIRLDQVQRMERLADHFQFEVVVKESRE